MPPTSDIVLRDTQTWLERAVIGLNLCPFATAVHAKSLVHFAISHASGEADLLRDLDTELQALVAHDHRLRATTLLVAPGCLQVFLAFNDFMGVAQRLLRKRGLEGIVQLATFHPAYQFADSEADDVTNFTNRSPYPIIHLLREDSIERAVRSMPDPAVIYEANIETLRRLGKDGWAALGVGPSA